MRVRPPLLPLCAPPRGAAPFPLCRGWIKRVVAPTNASPLDCTYVKQDMGENACGTSTSSACFSPGCAQNESVVCAVCTLISVVCVTG